MFFICGLYPHPKEGEPFQKFSVTREGQRGGLEIVFNQQLTRLGITSLAASLPQAQRWFFPPARPPILYPVMPRALSSAADVGLKIYGVQPTQQRGTVESLSFGLHSDYPGWAVPCTGPSKIESPAAR